MAAWLIFIAMAASLMACGGGDSTDSSTPNPLPAYRQQTLEWAPCDETILGLPKETTRKRWDQLGTRLQCSTMRVPMDWAQPDRSDVFVSVMRVAAADPVQRRGALLDLDRLERLLENEQLVGVAQPPIAWPYSPSTETCLNGVARTLSGSPGFAM